MLPFAASYGLLGASHDRSGAISTVFLAQTSRFFAKRLVAGRRYSDPHSLGHKRSARMDRFRAALATIHALQAAPRAASRHALAPAFHVSQHGSDYQKVRAYPPRLSPSTADSPEWGIHKKARSQQNCLERRSIFLMAKNRQPINFFPKVPLNFIFFGDFIFHLKESECTMKTLCAVLLPLFFLAGCETFPQAQNSSSLEKVLDRNKYTGDFQPVQPRSLS